MAQKKSQTDRLAHTLSLASLALSAVGMGKVARYLAIGVSIHRAASGLFGGGRGRLPESDADRGRRIIKEQAKARADRKFAEIGRRDREGGASPDEATQRRELDAHNARMAEEGAAGVEAARKVSRELAERAEADYQARQAGSLPSPRSIEPTPAPPARQLPPVAEFAPPAPPRRLPSEPPAPSPAPAASKGPQTPEEGAAWNEWNRDKPLGARWTEPPADFKPTRPPAPASPAAPPRSLPAAAPETENTFQAGLRKLQEQQQEKARSSLPPELAAGAAAPASEEAEEDEAETESEADEDAPETIPKERAARDTSERKRRSAPSPAARERKLAQGRRKRKKRRDLRTPEQKAAHSRALKRSFVNRARDEQGGFSGVLAPEDEHLGAEEEGRRLGGAEGPKNSLEGAVGSAAEAAGESPAAETEGIGGNAAALIDAMASLQKAVEGMTEALAKPEREAKETGEKVGEATPSPLPAAADAGSPVAVTSEEAPGGGGLKQLKETAEVLGPLA